ncbi:hypothetical protein TIFTF001_034914 [Ficus carica]|uniref:Uncharacterized protein n=1 Tax=Ficus carica TaxID=3494 RepID=A0AA88JB55_FICCA|nr:hypothetical protein TIFTF001_034914 [Ficus carica]
MLVRLSTFLTYVLQRAGGNLQLYSEKKHHNAGHSQRGKQPSAMVDTRWKGMAGQTVKCGSLQSWYQSGSLRNDFTVCLPSPPSLRMDMDSARINADRATVAAFYGSRPLLYDGTRRSVTVSAWLYDIEMIFYTCHIEDRLQVSLAGRCLIADARLWWMTYGEQQMPSRTWAHFRAVVLARYGPIPMGRPGDDGQYRDLEIYRDMHYRRYQSFVADWHAYPQESTGHYYCRFQEVILPYNPQDMPHP